MNDQERKRGHEEKGISVVVTLAKNENSRKILSIREGKKLSKGESHDCLSNIKIIILEGKEISLARIVRSCLTAESKYNHNYSKRFNSLGKIYPKSC